MYTYFAKSKIYLLFFLYLPYILSGRLIDTFYGPIEVEEPVLLELLDSPTFQRLKDIHQYGVAYYISHPEEYNRYDHSVGVFAILRANNLSIEEQIAGLLHDVSHTAFSHVGDWVFGKENGEKDYQNSIHALFLEKSELGDILKKYNFTVEQILPEEELFPALECSLPDLCADRIDYNIQGAYYQGFITHEEAVSIFKDLRFVNNTWVSSYLDLMKKITRFSLFMTQDCWGSPRNYIASRWLADAILRGFDIGALSHEEFHMGIDQEIWNKLVFQNDAIVEQKMKMVMNPKKYFSVCESREEADFVIKSKFRGIDPWVVSGSNCLRATAMDKELAEEYEKARSVIEKGWPVKVQELY